MSADDRKFLGECSILLVVSAVIAWLLLGFVFMNLDMTAWGFEDRAIYLVIVTAIQMLLMRILVED
jgi:hypothetical protein